MTITLFAQIVTGLFSVATLITGLAALIFNWGIRLLVTKGKFAVAGTDQVIDSPNVRGWGARQITSGVTLWAALYFANPLLFAVGLGSVVIRDLLDVLANILDRKYSQVIPFIVSAALAGSALLTIF